MTNPPVDTQAAPEPVGAVQEETRERIIRAARSLFRERGYEGTAMSQLAKHAGVTTPALYWHFESKAELCGAMLVREYRDFLEEVVRKTVGDSAEERLRIFTRTFVELQLGDQELTKNFGYFHLREYADEPARKEIKRLERGYITFVKKLLSEGQEAGHFEIRDIGATAMALTTMCEYVIFWYRPGGRLTAEELGELYADLSIGMVGAGSRKT